MIPGEEEENTSPTLPWLSSLLLLFCQMSQISHMVNNEQLNYFLFILLDVFNLCTEGK